MGYYYVICVTWQVQKVKVRVSWRCCSVIVLTLKYRFVFRSSCHSFFISAKSPASTITNLWYRDPLWFNRLFHRLFKTKNEETTTRETVNEASAIAKHMGVGERASERAKENKRLKKRDSSSYYCFPRLTIYEKHEKIEGWLWTICFHVYVNAPFSLFQRLRVITISWSTFVH